MLIVIVMPGSRVVGIGGPDTPTLCMEYHKAVNFLRSTGLEPMEKHKATYVGHHQTASEVPF